MKKLILILTLFTGVCFSTNELGLIIGEPTGISYRNWISSKNAIDLAVGWSFNTKDNNHLDIHASYLFHQRSDIRIARQRLPFYFGPGGRIRFGEKDIVIGFKVPLGLYFKFRDLPLSMFFELAPGMNITPSTQFDISGGLGLRYIFEIKSRRKEKKEEEQEIIKKDRDRF